MTILVPFIPKPKWLGEKGRSEGQIECLDKGHKVYVYAGLSSYQVWSGEG